MANYFYTDADGKQQGPIDIHGLRELVAQGVIVPSTSVKMEGEHSVFAARRISGLFPEYLIEGSSGDAPRLFDILFDIGFTRFVTNVWISFIWVIVIIVHVLGFIALLIGAGMMIAGGGNGAEFAAFLTMILGTVGLLLSFLFSRISLEVIIVIFRIETHLRAMRWRSEERRG